jgi:hypothetical protein
MPVGLPSTVFADACCIFAYVTALFAMPAVATVPHPKVVPERRITWPSETEIISATFAVALVAFPKIDNADSCCNFEYVTRFVGISAAVIVRNVGVPDAPDGEAKSRFAACELKEAVSVPIVVTGLPVTVKIEGIESPTLVTVPVPPVLEMVTTPSALVPVVASVIFVPSTNLTEPPELDSVTVWLVASDVFAIVCSSFVTLPSTSVPVTVKFGYVPVTAFMPPPVIETT